MQTKVTVVDDRVQVFVSGCFFESEAVALREKLHRHLDDERIHFSLDFSNVSHISNDGICQLICLQKIAETKGGVVRITGLTDALANSFKLLRLDKIFNL